MAKFGESSELVKCSFCGKSQKQVKKLIAGPGVCICNECVDLCNDIIEEELDERAEASNTGDPPSISVEVRAMQQQVDRLSEQLVELGKRVERYQRSGSLSGFYPVPVQAHPRRVEANHVSQARRAFTDLLLIGATAARCPLALLTVVSGDGWSTLSFGAEREPSRTPASSTSSPAARNRWRSPTRPATRPWPTVV